MANPWEAFCKRLDSSPTHTVLPPQCFNSVKIDGLNSVKRTFTPDERLLTCRNCGVIFVRDKAQSHYDAFPKCREKDTCRADILPYHAIEMYQKLYDEMQIQEKRALKRSKTEAVRRGKVIRNSSHAQFENNSAAIASDHSRKSVNLKSKALGLPVLGEASLERDKMSSSSSYDHLSCGEVNSPGSETESSSSAPSKLVENPPSVSAERNLFENLERDFASSAPKSRRVCGYNSSQLPSNQLSRSINSLLNDHLQSYSSSPASPHVDRKEATYVPPNVHSNRKQISIRTPRNDHTEVSAVRAAKQQSDPQIHGRMQSQFDSLMSTPFKQQQQRLSHQITPDPDSVDTVDLVSDGSPDSDYEIPNFYIPTEKSILSTYHGDETSQFSIGRQQASRSNAVFRNGSKNSFPDYVHLTKMDSSWDASRLSFSPDSWSRNSSMGGGSYYDNLEPMQVEKRSNYSMYNQRLRNPSEQSQDMVLRRSQRPNDSDLNLLEQCGCVEMGDVRCKNSIYCQVHTWEEKKRVQRSYGKSEILKDLRCQQKLSRMTPEAPRLNKIRRMSPSTTAAPNHPSRHSTASSIASASLMTVTAASSSRSASTGISFPQRLSGVSSATIQSTRHISVNGNFVESGSTRQQQHQPQQPTIVHRRVHNLSNLLRRSNQIWGQERPGSSFLPSSQAASLPPPAGLPPGCSSFAKVPRRTSHIEISGGVPEIQNRVVVNDEREKSITGRSRKASHNTAMRQACSSSSLQNTYFQHYTATSNRANPTALVFRTSPANSHLSSKIRVTAAAATAGREPGSVGLASTVNSSVSWMGYSRPFSISDIQLSASTTTGSTSTTLPRHSNSSNPGASAAIVNQQPGVSNRYIVIGSNTVGRTGSVSRLAAVANQDLFHQQQRQHSTSSAPSSGPPQPLGFPSSTIENPRELVIDLAEEGGRDGTSADFLFNGSVTAAANADASAEAAAAVANLEALGAGSSFCVNAEPEDVDLYLNHNPQQQQQQLHQLPRNQTGNGRPSSWDISPSGVGSASSI